MKVAQVSPLCESVPPQLYGGTERIVSYLTEELVRQGHEVTLFASADSLTSAKLVPCCTGALRLNHRAMDYIPYHLAMLDKLVEQIDEFDIVQFHCDLVHFPLLRHLPAPGVTTLHGRLDRSDLAPFFATFREAPLVAISNDQRSRLPSANWVGTIHHGIPRDLLPFHPAPVGDYLAFLGRISPEKGPDRAIEIARLCGMPLKIAAKIDRADLPYWDAVIRPMIDVTPGVEYVGEIGETEKDAFLGDAAALLFPINWPEPFGLVLIEAMATGTPVIAFGSGSVPEIIEDGVTGFVVDDVESGAAAVPLALRLDRATVRRRFEQRFTAERMARDYVAIFKRMLGGTPGLAALEGDIAGRSAQAAD